MQHSGIATQCARKQRPDLRKILHVVKEEIAVPLRSLRTGARDQARNPTETMAPAETLSTKLNGHMADISYVPDQLTLLHAATSFPISGKLSDRTGTEVWLQSLKLLPTLPASMFKTTRT